MVPLPDLRRHDDDRGAARDGQRQPVAEADPGPQRRPSVLPRPRADALEGDQDAVTGILTDGTAE
jgi:hypothetical protein